jgi:hypothetical protein
MSRRPSTSCSQNFAWCFKRRGKLTGVTERQLVDDRHVGLEAGGGRKRDARAQ